VTSAKKKDSHPKDEDIVELSPEATGKTAHKEEHKTKDHRKSAPSKKELLAQLENLEKEKADLSDRLLRTVAEFDNYRKRVSREKEDLIKFGNEKFALDLLPVVDNFERSLEQARNAREIEPVIEGIEMILKQFTTTLEKFHIKPFASIGEPFDPEKHEAMAQQEHEEYDENTVIEEYQKGYFLKERLLRPARVIVSKPPEEE